MIQIFDKGERVTMRAGGREVEGTIILASPNGKSLVVYFDTYFMGFMGIMPIMYDDRDKCYKDLITSTEIKIEKTK